MCELQRIVDVLKKLAFMKEKFAAAFLRVCSVFLDCIGPEVV